MKMQIINQGKPVINIDGIDQSYESIAIAIDLHSKYCELSGILSYEDGCPGIIIDYNERSLHLDESKDGPTEIKFPELKGYIVWSAQIQRYTLYLCFVKTE